MMILLKGEVWSESKDSQDIDADYKWQMMTIRNPLLINDISTEFTVEVADDGTTTVTTLDGSVLVTDMTSRKSVIVSANEQLSVPESSTGLSEQELQQSLTKIDTNSIDKWWE